MEECHYDNRSFEKKKKITATYCTFLEISLSPSQHLNGVLAISWKCFID